MLAHKGTLCASSPFSVRFASAPPNSFVSVRWMDRDGRGGIESECAEAKSPRARHGVSGARLLRNTEGAPVSVAEHQRTYRKPDIRIVEEK